MNEIDTPHRFRILAGGLAALAALAAIAGFAGPAGAVCPEFPDVPWWQNLSHEKVIRYVELKHDGKWAPYVAKWDRQIEKVEDIHKRGSRAVIKSRGVRLEGKHLKTYVGLLKQRASVNHCLAAEMKAEATKTPLPFKANDASS